jgi:hypothetical protein
MACVLSLPAAALAPQRAAPRAVHAAAGCSLPALAAPRATLRFARAPGAPSLRAAPRSIASRRRPRPSLGARAAAEADPFATAPLPVRLLVACSKERDAGLDEVRALLDGGANPSTPAALGRGETWTPMMTAAQSDSPAVLALLVQRGADPNARTPGGWKLECMAESHGYSLLSLDVSTALTTAALSGAEAAVRALLLLGADPRELHLDEYWDWQRAWSVRELASLHSATAAEAAQLPVVRVLLEAEEAVAGTPLRCAAPPDPLAGNAQEFEKLFPGAKRQPPRDPPGNGGFGAPWTDGMGHGADEVRAFAMAKFEARKAR